MSHDILREIRKSEEAFLDLSRLSGPDLGPIIQRALFHLEELRQNLGQSEISDPDLGKLFLKGFLGQVEEALLVSGSIVSMSTTINDDCDQGDWSNISMSLPFLIETLLSVPFEGHVNISIEPDHLKLKGVLAKDFDLKGLRSFSYSLTKSLLKNGIILTYGLESSHEELLSLDFHFPSPKAGLVGIPMNNGVKATVDGRLEQYVLNQNAKMPIGHIVIKIDKSGRAIRMNRVETDLRQDGRTLVYIPFLFRHVLFSFPKFETKLSKEIDLNETANYHYIDLFSLISD